MTENILRAKPDSDTLVSLGDKKFFFELGPWDEDGYSDIKPGWFNTMLFISDTDLSSSEIEHLASLIGYYWKVTVKGPALTGISRIATNAFTVKTSFYASQSYDPVKRFGQFVNGLNDFLMEGSPIRRGKTRLVEPFGREINLSVRIDEIINQNGTPLSDVVIALQEDDKPPAPMPSMPPSDSKPPAPMPTRTLGDSKPPAPMPKASKRLAVTSPLDACVSIMALDIAKEFLPSGEQEILEIAMDVVKQNTELKLKLKETEAKLKAIKKVLKG